MQNRDSYLGGLHSARSTTRVGQVIDTYGGTTYYKAQNVTASPQNQKGDFVRPNPFTFTISRYPFLTQMDQLREIDLPNLPWDADNVSISRLGPVNQLKYDITWLKDLCLDEAERVAYSKMIADCRNQSGLNLTVDFLQAGQILTSLRSARKFLSRISNGPPVDNGRKRILNGVPYRRRRSGWEKVENSSVVKMSAGEYLSYVYGWSPLASSVYGVVEQIGSNLADSSYLNHRNTFKVGRKWSEQLLTSYGFPPSTFAEHEGSWRCLYSINLAPAAKAVSSLVNRYASLNPLAIAWELVPYSFVVDWFYDIGGYLEEAEAAFATQCRFMGGFRTLTASVDAVVDIRTPRVVEVSKYRPGDAWETLRDGFGRSSVRYKLRTVLTSMPYPRPPKLKLDLGANRMLNAAALISQRVIKS